MSNVLLILDFYYICRTSLYASQFAPGKCVCLFVCVFRVSCVMLQLHWLEVDRGFPRTNPQRNPVYNLFLRITRYRNAKFRYFGWRHMNSGLATAQRFYFRNYLKNAQTQISVSSTFCNENTCKCTRLNMSLELSVCFPQPCWSASRRFAISGLHYYRHIISFPKRWIRRNS